MVLPSVQHSVFKSGLVFLDHGVCELMCLRLLQAVECHHLDLSVESSACLLRQPWWAARCPSCSLELTSGRANCLLPSLRSDPCGWPQSSGFPLAIGPRYPPDTHSAWHSILIPKMFGGQTQNFTVAFLPKTQI